MPGQDPYRQPEERPLQPEPPWLTEGRIGDVFLAILLCSVGLLGVVVGAIADSAAELTIGSCLVVLGVRVAWEARQISI